MGEQSIPVPPVVERFLRYVTIDTQSDTGSTTTPSTEKQKDLGRLLEKELRELGISDAEMDDYGYVYASIPASPGAEQAPALALVAHVDTSPDEPGESVRPVLHPDYDGGVVHLPGSSEHKLDPKVSPALADHVGHTLITSDGTTLLGSDDKAGVALIVQLAAELVEDPALPRPPLKLCFTVDEEIGRGVDEIDLDRLAAEVAYTVDGGGVGTFSWETFHAAEATVRVRGRMVHPGYGKGVLVNANTIASEIVAGLPLSEAPETTADREGYFCAHTFDGTVQQAEVRILLRDFHADGLARRKRMVQSLAETAALRHPGAEVEVEIEDNYKNMRDYIAESDPRVVSVAFEAAETMGLELRDELVRGGTDGSRLSEMGLPTPNVFTGGHDFHSRFEWNTVENLETALAYLRQLVAAWSQQDKKA